jgi:hypothetical protein
LNLYSKAFAAYITHTVEIPVHLSRLEEFIVYSKYAHTKNHVNILWHIDPLLGKDHEKNETTAVARQQPPH